MISILVRSAFTRPIEHYLDSRGISQRGAIRILAYEDLFKLKLLRSGTFVFADLERLTSGQSALAAELADKLLRHPSAFRVLNHPGHALRRFDLLRTLHQRGDNDFNVYRLSDARDAIRYPVFLRAANAHDGPRSRLLANERELDRAITRRLLEGLDPDQLILIEYCDTSDRSGVFEVRSCFRIGDRVFPHHMHRNNYWSVKNSYGVSDRELADDEMRFLRSRQADSVRPFFDLAGIDYGRIDYAFLKRRVQVWEINTNPIVLRSPTAGVSPDRLPGQELVASRLRRAFAEADHSPVPPVVLDLDWPALARRAVAGMKARGEGTGRSPRRRPGAPVIESSE